MLAVDVCLPEVLYVYACVPCSYTYVYTLSTASSHPIALIPDVAVVVPA